MNIENPIEMLDFKRKVILIGGIIKLVLQELQEKREIIRY